ncbi:MAG: hypothetical protein HYV27_02690 [Candidatus Hydrogenedentes bacterium]|nr:hypothetical protein [Candidatus Hydrogenedentota bacterium]
MSFPPKGFEVIQNGAWTFCARPHALEDLRAAVMQPGPPDAALDGGRGAVWTFESGGATVVLRRYRRGGLMQHLLHDRYLGNRPLAEFNVWHAAESAGLPVPALVGVAWLKRGLFYQGAIATALVEAKPLLDLVNISGKNVDALGRECGHAIRRMHDAGIWHADLQVKNILIHGAKALLIDFDAAKQVDSMRRTQRWRNLYRLRRSCEKHGLPGGLFKAICAGYGEPNGPHWLSFLYRLRRFF